MWVVENIILIYINWIYRFRNVEYYEKKWLNKILLSYGILKLYDDYIGIRNVN